MASQAPTRRFTCRACGSLDLTELFSLGEQFVSDFVEAIHFGDLPKVPITLDLCNSCTLVQARYAPPSDLLYKRHYHYRSGITDTMRAALADVVDAATRAVKLEPGDVVLDIGSNDGTLLRCYGEGIVKVGCEPAQNLHEDGSRGVDILIKDFWSLESYIKAMENRDAEG